MRRDYPQGLLNRNLIFKTEIECLKRNAYFLEHIPQAFMHAIATK
jgi:hypothetical protein